MGISQSPKIVSNGLVFYMDAGNPKSYKGPVITNQFLVPTPNSSNNVTFSVQGTGTFKRIFEGTYGGYSIKPDDVVYRYDLGVSGCHYHGNDATITAGHYATFQFEYYIDKSIANFPTTNYLANFENIGAGISSAVSVDAPTIGAAGNWRNVRFTTGAASSTAALRQLLYPGACGSSYLASSGYILYKNPAVWYTSFIPTANLPFVSGSRSSTQALLDITGNNTITVSSLTYETNGTFSFNGTNNYITTSFSTTSGQAVTYCGWLYSTETTATYKNFVDSASANPMIWWDTAGKIEFDAGQYRTPDVYRNQWVYVCLSKPSGSSAASYYVNGNLVGTGSAYTTPAGTPTWFNRGTGQTWKGNCSIAQAYNRALSAAEIQQNFNAHRGRYGI